jgi:protein O-mannosyl-transferase
MNNPDGQLTESISLQIPKPEKFFLPSLLIPVLFIGFSFLIYFPVFGRYFVSDDFKVLNRVCNQRIILIKGFFRPLSDLSIFMNYRLGGLNPIVFNSFNILIHGINAYLVFLCCICFGHKLDRKIRIQYALISSVLFISYPFHNEAVVWILGRGASMACLFVLLSVLSYYKIKKIWLKAAVVCTFYFISMLAFESTFVFPIIFLFLLFFENQSNRSKTRWTALLLLTLLIHLLIRINISGSLLGSYGSDFFHTGPKAYLLNILKVSGRLIFPPFSNSKVFSIFVLIAIVGAIALIGKNIRRFRRSVFARGAFILSGMLLIACVVPVVTGISTQTSESDRMLYFPSVFLCMLIGYQVVLLIQKTTFKILFVTAIMIYNLYFLELNNRNWKTASQITYSIVHKIQTENTTGKIFFLNIPNEIRGAYVFRLGFSNAVDLYGKDSRRFLAVNYLPRQDLEKMNTELVLNRSASVLNLQPDIVMKQDSLGCRQIYDHGILRYSTQPGDQIYFWNVDRLENIQACFPLSR